MCGGALLKLTDSIRCWGTLCATEFKLSDTGRDFIEVGSN